MALELYKKKRNFKKTPEPSGKVKASKNKLVFVIQRHKASHLHYDFRLEMDGVLKSWAVPKGPSLNPHDKRLAMMAEDHPFDYRTFEGIIPEGNYGAGIVEIWDEGELTDLDDSDKETSEKNLKRGLKAGNLKFKLNGSKLKGEFALVKIGNRGENAWLLIKHRDEFAVEEEYNSEQQTAENSPINEWLRENDRKKFLKTVKGPGGKTKGTGTTGRRTKNGSRLSASTSDKNTAAKRRNIPGIIKPMLARETGKVFSDKEWVYEIKWDGYRAIADVNFDKVNLYSRNGNSFNAAYPLVIQGLKDLQIDAVIDGEIIIVDAEGKSNFQLLQYYGSDDSHPIEFRVFDILFLDGKNLCDLPLIKRKEKLKALIGEGNDIVKYSDHIEEKGEEFFDLAIENDLEGIIAKRADSLYSPGVRTSEWLKIKYHKSTEAIIAGFTAPTGSRDAFGALILAKYDDGELKYIGHTGTGFTSKTLSDMAKLLKRYVTKTSPFKDKVKTNTPVTWVKPELVAEIKFTEWTKDRKLRHPVFLGLRNDKKANEITMKDDTSLNKTKAAPSGKVKAAKKKTASKEKVNPENETEYKFGRTTVRVSNPKKVFWHEEGFTKQDVVDYYISVSKYILPFLKDRPESLLRNPNGIHNPGFFQKDAGDEAPSWVKSEKIYSESTDKDIDYILCNNQATLTYMNNLGCIEVNPWHSTIRKPDHPDYMIIDIDPSDNNTFDQVVETAQVFREIFKKAGTESYCKTSGASGLHVYIPMGKKYNYDQVKDFAELVCMMAQEMLPEFTTMTRNLKKRGKDHIYLDHLQNRRGQTISSVYSLRPKPGATVSMPLKWSEVKPGISPKDFHIKNALKRIQKNSDLFTPVLGKGIDMEKCLKKLEA